MKTNKLHISAAIASLMSLGMVGQAEAYTSAGSVLEFNNVAFSITAAPGALDSYQYTTTNIATLNTVDHPSLGGFDSDTCGTATTTACGVTPALDSQLIKLGDSAHVANTFSLDGPNKGTEYSYADSVISSSLLSGGTTTAASLIAETELLSSGDGSADATLKSNSTFTWEFTITNNGSVTLTFAARAQEYSQSDNPGSIAVNASTSLTAQVLLTQNDGSDTGTWNPDGNGANGCTALNGVTCSLELDPFSLNDPTGIGSDPASDTYTTGGFHSYRIQFDGLADGTYSLTLNGAVGTQVSKLEESVPEPETLFLLGIGLLALTGNSARQSKKQQI